ncbi:hypothetical protein C0J52_20398 [Blattella germanica]|nr:hypothetical protein C0J52_20398 [Blattella germanica]
MILRREDLPEIKVCLTAFISLHGITYRRVQSLKKSLVETGKAPVDMRGKHLNRPHRLPTETVNSVISRISFLKGRMPHYSLHDTGKVHLSEDLSISKLHEMYRAKYPSHSVSYESYRDIFNNKFNIGFGYPRCDTCSECDAHVAKIVSLQLTIFNLNAAQYEEKSKLENEMKSMGVINAVHKKKAETFYNRKRQSKISAMETPHMEAILFDFQKNLPTPNITTSYETAFFSLIKYTCRLLSTREYVFYTYDQTIARKGADDVVSFLHHFIETFLQEDIKTLHLFCDSCGGQNKNYPVFRYLHWLINGQQRFEQIHMTFPVRGHSYLECDKNMGLINQKSRVETPNEWNEVIRAARRKPSPFHVVEVQQDFIYNWTSYFKTPFKKKCPFQTRPVTEIKFCQEHPRTVNIRTTYNGQWESYDVIDKAFIKAIEASATLHADKKTAMTSGPSTSITIPNIEIDAISLVPCSIPSTAESTSSLQQASLPVTSSFTTVAKLDVGFYAIQEKISDEYFKVQILKTPWNPPRDYKFPISTKRNLRFQLKWMERFPWLSYSEYKSGAYCRVCVVMGRSLDEGKGGHQRIGQLVTEPFCKWKNALEIFEAHAKSGYHKRNSELADNFLKVMSSQASSVIQQLSSERKRQQEENRKKLIPIILFAQLQRRDIDAATSSIDSFEKQMHKVRNGEISNESIPDPSAVKRKKVDPCELNREAKEICDVIIFQINERFKFTGNLVASQLFQKANLETYDS